MNPLEVSPADYHRRLTCDRSNVLSPDSWLSKSVIWELANTSLYSWRYFPKQFAPTSAMQWGSLIDCLTTTPDEVAGQVAISPFDSYRTKEAREWRDQKLNDGIIITTSEEMKEAESAAKMLMVTNAQSAEIFAQSQTQVIIAGMVAGARVKGLVDLAPRGESYLADLKTTSDFSLDGFSKTMATFGYHVQGGLYLALWNAMFPDDQRDSFRLIWQSSSAPYEVCVTEICKDDLERGLEYATHLIDCIVQATKGDHWPMLMEGKLPILSRPAWAGMREEAKIEESFVEVEEVA